jgi:hypothetical protein
MTPLSHVLLGYRHQDPVFIIHAAKETSSISKTHSFFI